MDHARTGRPGERAADNTSEGQADLSRDPREEAAELRNPPLPACPRDKFSLPSSLSSRRHLPDPPRTRAASGMQVQSGSTPN